MCIDDDLSKLIIKKQMQEMEDSLIGGIPRGNVGLVFDTTNHMDIYCKDCNKLCDLRIVALQSPYQIEDKFGFNIQTDGILLEIKCPTCKCGGWFQLYLDKSHSDKMEFYRENMLNFINGENGK